MADWVGPIAGGDLIAARWVGEGTYKRQPVEFHGHDIYARQGYASGLRRTGVASLLVTRA